MEQLWLICGWRHMRDLRLKFGWSALLVILLIPMGDAMRWVAIMCLFVAVSSTDALLTLREILEEGDRES